MASEDTKYIVTDEDGDEINVTLQSNTCRCSSNNCYEDYLEVDFDQNDILYRLGLEADEWYFFFKYLLETNPNVRKLDV